MEIELKIILTCLILWFITYLCAFPSSMFAKWGALRFKSYLAFLIFITLIYVIPAFIISIYWLWP